MRVVSVDPGREKCGLAVVESSGEIRERGVVQTERLESEFSGMVAKWKPDAILLGNGTFSGEIRRRIEPLTDRIPLVVVDERNSTYLSRKLYFKHNPPKGIWRFIPLGLQVPPTPHDDYAAAYMAIRYFEEKKQS